MNYYFNSSTFPQNGYPSQGGYPQQQQQQQQQEQSTYQLPQGPPTYATHFQQSSQQQPGPYAGQPNYGIAAAPTAYEQFYPPNEEPRGLQGGFTVASNSKSFTSEQADVSKRSKSTVAKVVSDIPAHPNYPGLTKCDTGQGLHFGVQLHASAYHLHADRLFQNQRVEVFLEGNAWVLGVIVSALAMIDNVSPSCVLYY